MLFYNTSYEYAPTSLLVSASASTTDRVRRHQYQSRVHFSGWNTVAIATAAASPETDTLPLLEVP